MRRLLSLPLALPLALSITVAVAAGPQFRLGFAALASQVPGVAGAPGERRLRAERGEPPADDDRPHGLAESRQLERVHRRQPRPARGRVPIDDPERRWA